MVHLTDTKKVLGEEESMDRMVSPSEIMISPIKAQTTRTYMSGPMERESIRGGHIRRYRKVSKRDE
jgi:hypothetical protein